MPIRYFLLTVLISIQCCESSASLPDPLEAGWEGEKVCHLITENDHIRVLKCVFPPGIGHELHSHKPHTGYTIYGGRFKITDANGDRIVNIPDGYSFSNDTIVVHQVLNIGNTTAEFLIMEY